MVKIWSIFVAFLENINFTLGNYYRKSFYLFPIRSNTVAKQYNIQKQNINKKYQELSKSPVKTYNLYQV